MSIRVKDLEFAYYEDGKPVLSALFAEFSEQEVTILTGASGSGKSTLLYLIAGLYPHNAGILRSGEIEVEGMAFAGAGAEVPDAAERSALVGMMFQNPDLQFCMDTVRNELIFCLENVRTDPERFEERIAEALEFCGLSGYEERRLHTLSGGEKQRVALACVYALRPKWLLLDEPFANIDAASAEEIRSRLQILHDEQGVGILAVEHRLDRWTGMADRIYIMEDGRLSDPLDGHSPDSEVLKNAGVLPPGEGYPPLQLPYEKEENEPEEPVLQLDQMGLSHEGRPILTGVCAAFRRGRIYAVVGASGSGKSSLFGALSGLYPYTGHIYLQGQELKKARKKAVGKIGFVTQSPQDQFIGGTVRQEVQAAFRKDADADERGEQILRSIRLWKYRSVSPYTLSQGQQRRLGVAALMAYNCEVLVCDEPTYAQDRNNTVAIMESLCRQAREHRIALIFSTHDREAAKAYADEILELKEGTLYAADQSDL